MEKKRVLAIDDEKDFLKVMKMNLEETGRYKVMTESSPEALLACLDIFVPDIILLDMKMPSMSGIEVCDRLNRLYDKRKVPIIALSALDSDRDKFKAYMAGIVDYIVKPVDKQELIRKIESALSAT